MEEKNHYYVIKGIAVVLLLASLFQILFWIGLAVISFSGSMGDADAEVVFFLLIPILIYLTTFLFIGVLGFLGSIGLFFFKKFGFYLILVSIAIYILSEMRIASLSANEHIVFSWWYVFYIVLILIVIYLLTQRKNIEIFQDSNSIQSKKIILISSAILCLVLAVYISAVSHYKDLIHQYTISHFSQNFSNGHNETSPAEETQKRETYSSLTNCLKSEIKCVTIMDKEGIVGNVYVGLGKVYFGERFTSDYDIDSNGEANMLPSIADSFCANGLEAASMPVEYCSNCYVCVSAPNKNQ